MSKTDEPIDKLFPEERRQRIVERLEHQPKILVKDLAEEFGVSQFTIRADFDELEARGLLLRCHGGALPLDKSTFVLDYGKRSRHMSSAKKSIGAQAALLVSEGDCISVDTGTTTVELVRNLNPQITVTIVTNDFAVANLVEETLPNATLFFLGGLVRRGYRDTASVDGLSGLSDFNTDKAFLSASGFTMDGGFMSEDPKQVQIKRVYLKSARKRYVLIDSSKFKRIAFMRYASIDDVDGIITECSPDPDLMDGYNTANCRCKLIIAK